MKNTFFKLHKLTILLGLLTIFTSWCPCHLPRFKAPCCIDGRRPQVMCSSEEWVWDYTLPTNLSRYSENGPKRPLTEEDFDPYRLVDRDYRLSIGDILEISVFGNVVILSMRFKHSYGMFLFCVFCCSTRKSCEQQKEISWDKEFLEMR